MTSIPNSDTLLSAAVVRASDVFTQDPRVNMVGDQLVWVVRSSPTDAPADSNDATKPVTVSVIDDATGTITRTLPLAEAPGYAPARAWISAERTDQTGNVTPPDDLYPGFTIASDEGTPISHSIVSTTTGGRASSLFYGPGMPTLLEPGTYKFLGWLEHLRSGGKAPGATCASEYSLQSGHDLAFDVVFPPASACDWKEPTEPSFEWP
jgi:hypothetical protein